MKKTVLAFILASSLTLVSLPVFAQEVSSGEMKIIKYTDISEHWAGAAMKQYADPEIFAGNEGEFIPDQAITRSEFVQMLHKALGIQIKYVKAPDIKEFFTDMENVDAGAYALYDLVVANIIDCKGEFNPDEVLVRDEMVHYIINALKSVTGGNYALIKMMPAPFADQDKITSAYRNDMVEAVLLKLVYGREENMFYPKEGSTRAEAAIVIERLLNVLEKLNANIEVKPSVEMDTSSLKMKLALTNHSRLPVIINHSSGQKYDFKLLDSDRNILYTWSADKSFITALTTTEINAEQTLEFTEMLDGEAFSSMKDRIAYMEVYITGESQSFTIDPQGYEVEIR